MDTSKVKKEEKVHPEAGRVAISRGNGAAYKIQPNGSMKRLSPAETQAVYKELIANPIEKECGVKLSLFYCTECGASRNEPCRKKEEYLR